MDTFLAEQGLQLNYLRDPSRSEAFDPCRILDDLCGDSMSGAMLPWQNGLRMAESDHLFLATLGGDGRYCGAVAGSDLATDREPFLFLDAAYLAPMTSAPNLLHRMLAFAMLRIAGEATLPTVIAACVQTPAYARGLRELGQRFTGTALFPARPDDVVIDLGMASLARRIARVVRPGLRYDPATGVFRSGSGAARPVGSALHAGSQRMAETLVVVDLSAADEATILDEARKLYRAWPKSRARQNFGTLTAGVGTDGRQPLPDATAL